MIRLLPAGALAAILAGGARMAAGLWPLEAGTPLAEIVYGMVDFGFLFALAALFLATNDRLGWRGWGPYLLAMAGAAILVGPDGSVAGLSGFILGAGALVLGLAAIGVLLLWRDRRFAAAAALWIAAFCLGFVGQGDWAGIAVGAGFAAAGLALLHIWRAPARLAPA